MISVARSEITRSLPAVLAEKPEVAALSYALSRQVAEFADKAAAARIYSNLDAVPESVLDVLASELMAAQYDPAFTVSAKRGIIKGALLNWITSGTVAQLSRSVEEIFGEGSEISEWFNYDGDPGYFKITTDNPDITDDTVEEFKAVVNVTKRLSAKLDGVTLGLSVEPMREFYAFVVQSGTTVQLTQKEE